MRDESGVSGKKRKPSHVFFVKTRPESWENRGHRSQVSTILVVVILKYFLFGFYVLEAPMVI